LYRERAPGKAAAAAAVCLDGSGCVI
jgi:hypothetical protein